MIYVASDTHFGHANIIRYCNRPFADVEEMDKALVENWNSIVKPEDTVIHVGDFAFVRKDYSKLKDILDSLRGNKILIRGNHDYSPEVMQKAGFSFVAESCTIVNNDVKYLFTHYPIDSESARLSILDEIGADFHIHGHVHNHKPIISGNRSINASVEGTNYTPFALSSVPFLYKKHTK